MNFKLLTRDDFRNGVFARDGHKCVVCGVEAADAHHILERRLWKDGGYYLANGASLCPRHHLEAESTLLGVEEIRAAAGIAKKIIPEHLYDDQAYDKWGNIVLPNGQRLKGELFFDESVQKILDKGNVLSLFTYLVKYPRTYHLPWSENLINDDRMLESLEGFEGQRVIVSEKMDGENTTMYREDIHARSLDGRNHTTRNWVKNFWSQFATEIPEGWRICGENLFAKHSIEYSQLPSFLMGFSIWNEKNVALSWDQMQLWFSLLGIISVPVIYDGIFDVEKIKALQDTMDFTKVEGYVVRVADEISYGDFRNKVGKYVRKNHVQTVQHWMHGQPIVKNKLAKV